MCFQYGEEQTKEKNDHNEWDEYGEENQDLWKVRLRDRHILRWTANLYRHTYILTAVKNQNWLNELYM